MIKFYLKIQNKMITKNLLYIVSGIVIIFNVILRIFPEVFIKVPKYSGESIRKISINATEIYTYCDVYLLVLFIILIFFFLGVDFNNSMEEIGLAIGGSKTNKFMVRKLFVLLLIYSTLYIITFINIYNLYIKLLLKYGNYGNLIPLKEIIFYSLTTNIFIISLSLFILFITRDIAVSTSIITAYYLLEESLWRCKIMQTKGILGHIYQYFDYAPGELVKVKLFYIFLSVVLLIITYKLSIRKIGFRLIKKGVN